MSTSHNLTRCTDKQNMNKCPDHNWLKLKICIRYHSKQTKNLQQVCTRSKKSAADVLEFFLMPKEPNLTLNLSGFFYPLTLLRFHSAHLFIPYHFQGFLQSVLSAACVFKGVWSSGYPYQRELIFFYLSQIIEQLVKIYNSLTRSNLETYSFLT